MVFPLRALAVAAEFRDESQSFYAAIRANDLVRLEAMLKQGANVNAKDGAPFERRQRLGSDCEPIAFPTNSFAGCRTIADRILRARKLQMVSKKSTIR
jgi:hypothetical protein